MSSRSRSGGMRSEMTLPVAAHLDIRLRLRSGQRLLADAVQPVRQRRRRIGQPAPRGHAHRVQRPSLASRQVGHQGQVILAAPLVPARLAPAAEVAMPHRFRLRGDGNRRFGIVEHALQLARHQAAIGRVVGHAQALRLPLDPAQRQVHPVRLPPLHGAQQVGVHADLQHGGRRWSARQLRVPDFIAPGPEVARRLDAPQEVRIAQPPVAEQHRLVDDVDALPHGPQGGVVLGSDCPRRGHGVRRPDLADAQVLRPQRFQKTLFVFATPPRHAVEHRVVAIGSLEVAQGHGPLQVGQVPALQERHQIGGGVHQAVVNQLHRRFTSPSPWPPAPPRPHTKSAQARCQHTPPAVAGEAVTSTGRHRGRGFRQCGGPHNGQG